MTTQYRNNQLRRLGHLFAGADAGIYDLPQRVEDARAAIDRLTAEKERVNTRPAHALDGWGLVEQITTAALTGSKFPTADQLVKVEQQKQAVAIYGTAINSAAESLENALEAAVTGTAAETIVEHLRPALEQVMAETAELTRALAPYGLDPADLLDAPDEARQARVRFDQVGARYKALRNAQTAVCGFSPPPDEGGRFFEVENFPDLTAGYRPGVVPWPTDNTIGKLAWFVEHGARVWMPTLPEREARFADHLATRLTKRERASA